MEQGNDENIGKDKNQLFQKLSMQKKQQKGMVIKHEYRPNEKNLKYIV